ncbi:MAG: DUF1292 domain-containing protein [Clostridia bacterium]|nr:DUF1292 domain-containing protein [Clostridia bacterium]
MDENKSFNDVEEFEDDDIITLISPDGEEIDFVEIAGIVHEGKFYAMLQPVELIEGMEDDEALVFEVVRDEDDNDNFNIVTDDEILDIVFKKYNDLLDSQED